MVRTLMRTATLALALTAAAVLGTAVAASADTGGGCQNTNNLRVCISVHSGTTDPLYGDFYVMGHSLGEAKATVYIIVDDVNGNVVSTTKFVEFMGIPANGYYGAWSKSKGIAHGKAHTLVIAQYANNNTVYAAYSPFQVW